MIAIIFFNVILYSTFCFKNTRLPAFLLLLLLAYYVIVGQKIKTNDKKNIKIY